MLPSVSSSSTAIGFFSLLLLVSLFITQYDIEEVQQHCNHTCNNPTISPFLDFISESRPLGLPFDFDLCVTYVVSQQEIVSLYERFCQLDHSGGGFIFVDEFLSVSEFAPNPLSQFWLGGRRYWGRGIGARPHFLLGDASVSTPNFLFSSERFDPTTKLLSFGGEFRKIFKGGLTKNKRFFALLSSPALMQIGKL